MKPDLLEQAKAAVRLARKKGADHARARISQSRVISVDWLNGKAERVRESTKTDLAVELYVRGRYSENQTGDFREQALEKFIADTVAMTGYLSADEYRNLPDPSLYPSTFLDRKTLFDDKADFNIDRCRKLASRAEEMLRSLPPGGEIVATASNCSFQSIETAMATSNGMEGAEPGTLFYIEPSVSLKDKLGVQSGWSTSRERKLAELRPLDELAREAMERATAGLGAGPTGTGTYAFVVENRTAARLVDWMTGALQGRPLFQDRSFLKQKMGKTIASKTLTLIDDPHVPGGIGSCSFDREGMATRKRTIIDGGVLKSFYLDTYYAARLGMDPTGADPGNLVYPAGESDLSGLIRKMGDVILVTLLMGGNSNGTTGDFSTGVRGFEIKNGKIEKPVSEMNLSGNHLDIWHDLVEVGNDPISSSKNRTPSMLFKKGTFSGK